MDNEALTDEDRHEVEFQKNEWLEFRLYRKGFIIGGSILALLYCTLLISIFVYMIFSHVCKNDPKSLDCKSIPPLWTSMTVFMVLFIMNFVFMMGMTYAAIKTRHGKDKIYPYIIHPVSYYTLFCAMGLLFMFYVLSA